MSTRRGQAPGIGVPVRRVEGVQPRGADDGSDQKQPAESETQERKPQRANQRRNGAASGQDRLEPHLAERQAGRQRRESRVAWMAPQEATDAVD